MKKFLSTLMAICLCLSLCACLIACDETGDPEESQSQPTPDEPTSHEHSFGSDWQKDGSVHWRACTGGGCKEIADRAEHVWTDMGVIVEPTQDSNGTLRQKCSVCEAVKDSTVAFEGINENKWNTMLSDANFENFTLLTEGNMTTTQGGQTFGPYKTKSACKMTADKMALILYDAESDAPIPGDSMEIFEGEIAEAQRQQYTQLFLNILSQYESFSYDADNKIYQIDELTVWNGTIKGISMREEEVQLIDVPCTIEIRNAEAALSVDGKILSLVCDYTQTMTMDGEEIVAFGVTTWTFSDYGTTVIE